MQAFVLIQTRAGSERIGWALLSIPGVEWTDDLTGAFDAIALASAASMHDLAETVIQRIRDLPAVTQALPAPVVRTIARPGRPEEVAA